MTFWQDKKVLVTGADGFIGSNLTAELVNQGAKVFALVFDQGKSINPIFTAVRNRLGGVIQGDIRNFEFLNQAFTDYEIDTCFHLAAQPIVSQAFADPLPTFEINIWGSINVLEAARRSAYLQRLVIASTTHVYGDNKNLPYLESYFPQPSRPYETSKACVDMLAQTYYYTYNLPVAISRCTNTYGPGDLNFSRLVPKTFQTVSRGFNPEIISGTAKRDFIYIKDVVSAYLILAENLERAEVRGQAFNFGSGTVSSAMEVAEAILTAVNNPQLAINVLPGDLRKEIPEQYVSVDKAKQFLGWQAKYSLEQGLQETWKWYQDNLQ